MDTDACGRNHGCSASDGQRSAAGRHPTQPYTLTGARVVVGREEGCELLFDDATVSRTHGAVELRFQLPRGHADPATGRVPPTAPHNVEYRVQSQSAGQLNNVGHDQYNAYIQQVREERDSFARDIASTKTKASRLIWIGFGLFVVGVGTYARAIIRFAGQVDSLSIDEPDVFDPPSLFGPQVAGIPIGLIGFALAGIASLLLVVGIVLHVVAAARRRRLDTQSAAPWQVVPPAQWHN